MGLSIQTIYKFIINFYFSRLITCKFNCMFIGYLITEIQINEKNQSICIFH